jgi:hypothetical protein
MLVAVLFLTMALHAPIGLRTLLSDRARLPLVRMLQDDDGVREALRMPNPGAPKLRDEPPTPPSSERDLLIPVISVGSFACFGLLIANEYLTRGVCPPFLNTCFSLSDDAGGWGS